MPCQTHLCVLELAQQLNGGLGPVLLSSWHVYIVHKEDNALASRGAVPGMIVYACVCVCACACVYLHVVCSSALWLPLAHIYRITGTKV
jgi:hypothetical protein